MLMNWHGQLFRALTKVLVGQLIFKITGMHACAPPIIHYLRLHFPVSLSCPLGSPSPSQSDLPLFSGLLCSIPSLARSLLL